MISHNRGIVVGFDGSVPSGAALDWAAAEAERRRLPLTVLLAIEDPVPPSATRAARLGLAEPVVHRYATESVRRARRSAASVEIVVETHLGAPGQALIQKSGQAELVVVGVEGCNRAVDGVAGPVALDVSAHAHCPVKVVGVKDVPLHAGNVS